MELRNNIQQYSSNVDVSRWRDGQFHWRNSRIPWAPRVGKQSYQRLGYTEQGIYITPFICQGWMLSVHYPLQLACSHAEPRCIEWAVTRRQELVFGVTTSASYDRCWFRSISLVTQSPRHPWLEKTSCSVTNQIWSIWKWSLGRCTSGWDTQCSVFIVLCSLTSF